MAEFRLETERLILREWREADVVPFHAICRDPQVMQFIGPLQDEAQVRSAIQRQSEGQAANGFCYWAMELRETGAFVGFCGLMMKTIEVPMKGGVDAGWRVASDHWRRGYALEAAGAAIDWGFGALDCDTIWAVTVPANIRSWQLMKKLGMVRRADCDFDHPALLPDDPLRPHISYSIAREKWLITR